MIDKRNGKPDLYDILSRGSGNTKYASNISNISGVIDDLTDKTMENSRISANVVDGTLFMRCVLPNGMELFSKEEISKDENGTSNDCNDALIDCQHKCYSEIRAQVWNYECYRNLCNRGEFRPDRLYSFAEALNSMFLFCYAARKCWPHGCFLRVKDGKIIQHIVESGLLTGGEHAWFPTSDDINANDWIILHEIPDN